MDTNGRPPSETGIQIDLDRLVRLTSGMAEFASQIPAEGPLGQFLADEMRRQGCFDEVRLQPVVPGRWNVIGILRGTGPGRSLLLNGHMDVPFPTGEWTRDPYDGAVENGRIHGVGLTDMKGAVASMIVAAEALAAHRSEFDGEVVVSAVIHHNVCGLGTKFFLANWDRPIDAAINGEPTDLGVQLAHGGAWQFEIITRGIAKHSSRAGINAIEKMRTILDKLSVDALTYEISPEVEGLPRLVVGSIEGGHSPSRSAERCVVKGDIRTVPGMTEDSLRADLTRIIESAMASDGDIHAELDGLSYQRPFLADKTWEIVEGLGAAHERVTGTAVRFSRGLPVSSYVTDSSDLARAGIPTVLYGPGDWVGEPDESISIADLETAARVYAQTALNFLR